MRSIKQSTRDGEGAVEKQGDAPKMKTEKKKGTLFKKLSSTLSSRAPRRAISDFQITLDDAHRQFAPGELVTGVVSVVAEKDFKITHLVVNLRGFVELFNGPTNGGIHAGKKKSKDPANLANITDTTSTLCTDEQVLCGEGKLEAGVYKFQFVMVLPGKGLPSSLDFEKGKIEYKVTASLTRPVSVSPVMVCSTTFSVREKIDVAPLKAPPLRLLSIDQSGKKSKTSDAEKKKAVSEAASPSSSSPHLPLDASSSSQIPQSPTLPPQAVATPSKQVTASIELLRGGCLAGGVIPMQVKISHVKPIKSICGVIITLYRLGTFDTLSLAPPAQKAKAASKKVSFSGSSMTAFRKELDQVVLPLIVDPLTLTCTLKPYIRVPEDAFPTIGSVPLGLVSFKYYIEVVVDLGGKIAHRDELFVPVDSSLRQPPAILDPEDYRPRPPAVSQLNWIFETDRIRREKNVKACRFEIVVGTTDSRGSQPRQQETLSIPEPISEIPEETVTEEPMSPQQESPYFRIPPESQSPPPPVHEFPLPEAPSQPLDEKALMRMHEERLLPSSPPDFSAPEVEPTAPPITMAHPTFLAINDAFPPEEPSEQESSEYPLEDKQELERQRLLAEASEAPSAPPGANAPEYAPSAPPLPPPEDESANFHTLPRYYQ